MNNMKKSLKTSSGITLIALVITIIVLLILAGISISMLSGNNSILQRTTDAKTLTEKATIIENAKTDILGQQTENKGANITKEQLATILNKYFVATPIDSIPDEVSSEHDLELTTLDEKHKIGLSEIFKGKFGIENSVVTWGEKYEDSMIGKTIDFKSEKNNVNDWIILGKQMNEQGKNDLIITTQNPVSSQSISGRLVEWIGYEDKIKNVCKNYVGETGTLGSKTAEIREVRSITLNDINTAVGFKEEIEPITISSDNGGYAYPNSAGTGWIKNTDSSYASYTFSTEAYDYYRLNENIKLGSVSRGWTNQAFNEVSITLEKKENLKYIFARNVNYWVASRELRLYDNHAVFTVGLVSYGHVTHLTPDRIN